MSHRTEGSPRTIEDGESQLVNKAVQALDRAERQANLTATELNDLRKTLEQFRLTASEREGERSEAIDPEKLRWFIAITTGAASAAAAGAVSGTLLGTAFGTMLLPGIGTIAGAFIGAGIAAARERGARDK